MADDLEAERVLRQGGAGQFQHLVEFAALGMDVANILGEKISGNQRKNKFEANKLFKEIANL